MFPFNCHQVNSGNTFHLFKFLEPGLAAESADQGFQGGGGGLTQVQLPAEQFDVGRQIVAAGLVRRLPLSALALRTGAVFGVLISVAIVGSMVLPWLAGQVAAAIGLRAALALGACDSGGPDGPGSMSILLTDAPGDVDQAVVTIERIEIVGEAENGIVALDLASGSETVLRGSGTDPQWRH